MTWNNKKLIDFFVNFDKNNPNHIAAVQLLQASCLKEMHDEAIWVRKYREKPVVTESERVPQKALEIIKEFEGFSADPYICPAGVATIGFGSTYYPGGRKVAMGDSSVSKAEGEQLLRHTVEQDFVAVLEKTIPYWADMDSGKRSALISFAYNLGAHFYGDTDNFGSITRVLKNKEWDLVPETLLKYRNPGSSFEAGLRRRREAEGKLWKGQ